MLKKYTILTFILLVLVGGRPAFAQDAFSEIKDYNLQLIAKNELVYRAEKLLLDKNYEALDHLADSYRKSKEYFIDGEWNLSVLYDGLSFYQNRRPEEDWKKRIEQLQDWSLKRPDSITPKIALAECLIGYAFHGRGYLVASETEEYRWRIFNERMNQSNKVISEALILKESCPALLSAILRIGTTFLERADYEKIYDKAITYDQKYNVYYFRKAWNLLPRWNGAEGELVKFAENSANAIGGNDGDVLYAQIIWFVQRKDHPNLFPNDVSGVSWERVAKGLKILNERNAVVPGPQ